MNIANEDEQKATALILIGPGVIEWTPERVKAGLKERAFSEAKVVLEEMEHATYNAKYISALGLLKGVILINSSRTAVTWPDGKVIVTVPVGQDPIAKIGEFLSGNDEAAMVTLQEIGERTTRAYVKKTIPDVKKVVGEIQDKQELERVEAAENKPERVLKEVVNPDTKALAEAQKAYFEMFGKKVAAVMRNNLEWINKKLEEGPSPE